MRVDPHDGIRESRHPFLQVRTESACLDPGRPASRTERNQCLLFINNPRQHKSVVLGQQLNSLRRSLWGLSLLGDREPRGKAPPGHRRGARRGGRWSRPQGPGCEASWCRRVSESPRWRRGGWSSPRPRFGLGIWWGRGGQGIGTSPAQLAPVQAPLCPRGHLC